MRTLVGFGRLTQSTLSKVDSSYLNSHGVIYANTPVAVSEPTAITTVQLIFQTVRAASQAEAVVRRGEWRRGLQSTPDVRDLTIGIIGMGTIGKVRELLHDFNSGEMFDGFFFSSFNANWMLWDTRLSIIIGGDSLLLVSVFFKIRYILF